MDTEYQSKAIENMAEPESQEPEEQEEEEKESGFQEEIEDEEMGAEHYEELAAEYPQYADQLMQMAADERRHQQILESWEAGGQGKVEEQVEEIKEPQENG